MMLVLRALFALLMWCSLLVLNGCVNEPLVASTDERESLAILSALAEADIRAQRVRNNDGDSYQIVVPASDMQRAASVIAKSDLLERRTQRLEQLLERKTFVPPTPEENRMRRDYLIALQLERAIYSLGGISRVRVIFPHNAPLLEDGTSRGYSEFTAGAQSPVVTVRYHPTHWTEERLAGELMGILRQSGIRFEGDPKNAPEGARRVTLIKEEIAEPRLGSELQAQGTKLISLPFPFSFSVPQRDLLRVQAQLYAIFIGAVLSSLIVGMYLGMVIALRRQRWARGIRRRERVGKDEPNEPVQSGIQSTEAFE